MFVSPCGFINWSLLVYAFFPKAVDGPWLKVFGGSKILCQHSYPPSNPLSIFMLLFPNFKHIRAIKHYWPKVLNGHKEIKYLSN